MKRILVTGARGFVGRHVTPLLAASGYDVHAVTNHEPPNDLTCTWHRANLIDESQREALISAVGADALVHLAWTARPPHYWTDPENLRWLSATLELVRSFSSRGGTRVVGAGTCAEYDWSTGHCSERSTPLRPASLYGTTKAACGSVLERYGQQTGLSVAWGRLFFLFGPGDAPSRLIPSLTAALARGERACCRAGNHVRDFIYVADAAAALVALLESEVTGAVNIASGSPARIGDVARAVAEHAKRPDLLSVEPGPSQDAVVTADVSRLRGEVGWRPQVDVMARIDETVRWTLAQAS
jgi:nucleoside-diphosphate-sugar epimerase